MTLRAGTEVTIALGDGGSPETFHALAAATLLTLSVTQQAVDSPAVATDAWANAQATRARRLSMSCQAAGNDGDAALRLREAALSGEAINAQIALGGVTLSGGFLVTQYREAGSGDDAKRLACTLVSATTVLSAPDA